MVWPLATKIFVGALVVVHSAAVVAAEPRSQLHVPATQPDGPASPSANAPFVKSRETGKTSSAGGAGASARPAPDPEAARAAIPPSYVPAPSSEGGAPSIPSSATTGSTAEGLPGGSTGVADNPVSPLQTASVSTRPIARLVFASGASALNDDVIRELDAVATRMAREADRRLQVVAYARRATTESDARRLSLTRAIAVRGHLLERGIAQNRIDVRALGDRAPGDPKDRVDLLFVGR